MATGRGLGGWTDGRAQAASGDLRAGIEGSGGGGGVAYEDGRARGYKQGWADGRAGRRASRWPKSSQRAILARNNDNSNNNTSVSIYRHKVKLLFFSRQNRGGRIGPMRLFSWTTQTRLINLPQNQNRNERCFCRLLENCCTAISTQRKTHRHGSLTAVLELPGDGGSPHCGCGPHLIHGVEVSALLAPRCRLPPHCFSLSSTGDISVYCSREVNFSFRMSGVNSFAGGRSAYIFISIHHKSRKNNDTVNKQRRKTT